MNLSHSAALDSHRCALIPRRTGATTSPARMSSPNRSAQQKHHNGCWRAGRVKTLHPGVHGGILARRDLPEHLAALEQHGIGAIDAVVVNLYPFRATVTAKTAPTFDVAVENIDIGPSPDLPPNAAGTTAR